MTWQTFWMEPTNLMRLALRRYSSSDECKVPCVKTYHNAQFWLPGDVEIERDERGYRSMDQCSDRFELDDPRWPTKCHDCEYEFTRTDNWQTWSQEMWRRTDNGELRIMHRDHPDDVPMAEIGASWDAFWMREILGGRNPDGIVLTVRCPPEGMFNDWMVDHEASSGGYWARTGDPRQCNVTATPSIAIGIPGTPGYYHGFLQNGVLTDHIG
jgi:hypothetical protein